MQQASTHAAAFAYGGTFKECDGMTACGDVRSIVGRAVRAAEQKDYITAVFCANRHGVTLAIDNAVDCWIGVVTEVDRRVVRLAGRFTVAQVPELLAACADGKAIELDLTDLVSADVAGIEALQRVRGKGVALVGTPGYIQMKLDSPPFGPQPAPPRPRGRR